MEYQKIAEAIESAAIEAEEIANKQALERFKPNEDELNRREKVARIVEEAFAYIAGQLRNNKTLDTFALDIMLPNIELMTTVPIGPFSQSISSILKTGQLPPEQREGSFTLINSLLPPQ